MSQVKTYQAASLEAALDLVHAELGVDAIVLQTRQTELRGLWPWSRGKMQVEVTARTNDGPKRTSMPGRSATSDSNNDLALPPSLLEPRPRPNAAAPTNRVAGPLETITRRDMVSKEVPRPAAPSAWEAERSPAVASARYIPHPDSTAAIQQRLDLLQKMLEDLGRQAGRGMDELPTELFPCVTKLIDAEVEPEVARSVVHRVKALLPMAQRRDLHAVQCTLTAVLEQELRLSPPLIPKAGRRQVVALVGPTGVGKTTTIAKLAANLRLREGAKIGLVTVDTYRVAAVEQLRTYAQIMDLPMHVVTNAEEMKAALDDLTGVDVVLIDTAGRSPRDELKIKELRAVMAVAQPDEVHLVMSLSAGTRSLQTVAAQFLPVGVTAVILSKLDEAAGAGGLLNAARLVPWPISYVTTGQDVPDDIEVAQATRMARLISGQEALPLTEAANRAA